MYIYATRPSDGELCGRVYVSVKCLVGISAGNDVARKQQAVRYLRIYKYRCLIRATKAGATTQAKQTPTTTWVESIIYDIR